MVRLLGAALVAAGAAWLGFAGAAALDRRAAALEELAAGLALLEQELAWDSPPLPTLMERLLPRCRGEARALVRDCLQALDRLDREPLSDAWARLVEGRTALGPEGRSALAPLGAALGRRAEEEQRRAAARARQELERLALRAREESRRQGRVYRALGLSGGAFLAILLL